MSLCLVPLFPTPPPPRYLRDHHDRIAQQLDREYSTLVGHALTKTLDAYGQALIASIHPLSGVAEPLLAAYAGSSGKRAGKSAVSRASMLREFELRARGESGGGVSSITTD